MRDRKEKTYTKVYLCVHCFSPPALWVAFAYLGDGIIKDFSFALLSCSMMLLLP